jgi:hypothetical protein
MTSYANPKQAPSGPSVDQQSPKSLVDMVSIGTSSRAWRLPFDARTSGQTHGLTFSGPNEYETARNACQFLRDHSPDIYTAWRDSYFKALPQRAEAAASARRLNLPVAVRALFEIEPREHSRPEEPLSISKGHPLAPPRAITLPTIDEQHWYYRRHFNIGNYVIGARDHHAASTMEAQQDVESLRHYISRYDALAQDTSGKNLFDATTWAAFRDPYFSCMEMCIRDLNLPSHFLALIHYGIGIHLAIGQRFNSWSEANVPPEERALLANTHHLFARVAAMYQADFPH